MQNQSYILKETLRVKQDVDEVNTIRCTFEHDIRISQDMAFLKHLEAHAYFFIDSLYLTY